MRRLAVYHNKTVLVGFDEPEFVEALKRRVSAKSLFHDDVDGTITVAGAEAVFWEAFNLVNAFYPDTVEHRYVGLEASRALQRRYQAFLDRAEAETKEDIKRRKAVLREQARRTNPAARAHPAHRTESNRGDRPRPGAQGRTHER